MSIWFKDVDDYDSAERATRAGMWAALVYVAWVIFRVGLTLATTDAGLLFTLMTPLEKFYFFGIVGVQIGVALIAAWRFRLGKGAIAGSLAALVLVGIVALDVANGIFQGIIWYVLLLGILMALINGARGAFALRAMHNPEGVVEAFE